MELIVMILAFVVLADYEIQSLGKIAGDIYLMTLILYLVVLGEGIILSVRKMKSYEFEMELLKSQLEREKIQNIEVRVDRKNIILDIAQILYIESLSDYVQIRLEGKTYITKERISRLGERLPSSFMRIHRSFIINADFILSYTSEEILIKEITLPIGRKYRKGVIEVLRSTST